MLESFKRGWVTWLIIAFCVLSIPVGLMADKLSDSEDSDGSSSGAVSLSGKNIIRVIYLTGMIVDRDDEGPMLFAGSTQSTLKRLQKASESKAVKGVLLRINSPGGTVAASQELHQAVEELSKKKPVYTSMGDISASGGYYVACASDKIFANPGTLTGSIGVIMNMMNVKGLADKLGIEPKMVKSGKFKDITSPYRPMTDDEKDLLQALITDSYKQFVGAVSKGRKMKEADVEKLADGRIFTGLQAHKVGLVDQIGSHKDAITALQKACKEKYGLKNDLKVEDRSSGGFLDSLLETDALAKIGMSKSPVDAMIPLSMQARFHHRPLWIWQ